MKLIDYACVFAENLNSCKWQIDDKTENLVKCIQHCKAKMILSNTGSNAYKIKMYGSVRQSLCGIYKDEPEFLCLSAIINNLFQ